MYKLMTNWPVRENNKTQNLNILNFFFHVCFQLWRICCVCSWAWLKKPPTWHGCAGRRRRCSRCWCRRKPAPTRTKSLSRTSRRSLTLWYRKWSDTTSVHRYSRKRLTCYLAHFWPVCYLTPGFSLAVV